MKKFLAIAMGVIFSAATLAQSEKYQAAMKQNIDELEAAMGKGTMPDLANIDLPVHVQIKSQRGTSSLQIPSR